MTIRTYSTAEVADSMGCSERWLIEQLRSNRFPGYRAARHWRMTDRNIQDALDICANGTRRINGNNAAATASGPTPTSRKRAEKRPRPPP